MNRDLRLEGFGVRLEPLARAHLPELVRSCSDARLWELVYAPNPFLDGESASAWLAAALAEDRSVPFAIVDATTERVLGSTRFLDIDESNRKLEIGWTFLAPEAWRTHVNSACKYALLRYAFETFGAVRVQFKAEAINLRSCAAIERIGAKREGTLRAFRIRSDGEVRDVAIYSIVAEEWPAVETRLREGLSPSGRSRGSLAAE